MKLKMLALCPILIALGSTAVAEEQKGFACKDRASGMIYVGTLDSRRNCDLSNRVLLRIDNYICTFAPAGKESDCDEQSIVPARDIVLDDFMKSAHVKLRNWRMK